MEYCLGSASDLLEGMFPLITKKVFWQAFDIVVKIPTPHTGVSSFDSFLSLC